MSTIVAFVLFHSWSQAQPTTDWPALVQKPFEAKRTGSPSLPPLLMDGESMATRQEWEKSRLRLHERWRSILGESPKPNPNLNVQARDDPNTQGFRRRLVSFDSEGDDRIQAALLIPEEVKSGERRPTVVVFHETTALAFRQPAGMAGPPDRHFGVELVRRGYVVLCPECFILKGPNREAAGGPINVAKTQAAALRKRRPGWTGVGKLTFDASRCVDFLESLEFVDKSRIGCLGFSLGAKEVVYAMAFEPRFKAGVANEGGVGIRMSNWSDDWYLGSSIKDRLNAVDHHQLLALAAPRAILLQGGGSADGDASWPYVAAALPIYRLHGAPDRIGLHHHGGKHTFPTEARRVAYRWLDCWLHHPARQTR